MKNVMAREQAIWACGIVQSPEKKIKPPDTSLISIPCFHITICIINLLAFRDIFLNIRIKLRYIVPMNSIFKNYTLIVSTLHS